MTNGEWRMVMIRLSWKNQWQQPVLTFPIGFAFLISVLNVNRLNQMISPHIVDSRWMRINQEEIDISVSPFLVFGNSPKFAHVTCHGVCDGTFFFYEMKAFRPREKVHGFVCQFCFRYFQFICFWWSLASPSPYLSLSLFLMTLSLSDYNDCIIRMWSQLIS